MLILAFLFFFLFYVEISYCKGQSLAHAVISAYLLQSVLTVVFAELLSLVFLYRLWPLTLCWLAALGFLCIWGREELKTISQTFLSIKQRTIGFIKRNTILCGLLSILLLMTILRAVLYPPQNVDSLQYHLSRAFMYYKQGSIHNFPHCNGWTNYSGPMNAVKMAQLFIAAGGRDGLLNFIQLFPLLLSGLCVYRISMGFGCGEKSAMAAAFMTMTIPLGMLQAATTQCDLLTASFSVCSVYEMLYILDIEKPTPAQCLLLGASVGCALFSKITAGLILLPFVLYFVIVLLKRRGFLVWLRSGAIICCAAVAVMLGFMARNAIDLNGDFLALSVSASLSGGGSIQNMLGRALLNLGWMLGGNNVMWCKCLDEVLLPLYHVLGANEPAAETFSTILTQISHDIQPMPLFLFAGLVSALWCMGTTLRKQKNAGMYALSCGISLFLIVSTVSINAAKSSPRYALGAVMLFAPLIGILVERGFPNGLPGTDGVSHREASLMVEALLCGCAFFCAFMVHIGGGQSLAARWYALSREELRDVPYAGQGWQKNNEIFCPIIEENGATVIGIGDEGGGYYTFIRNFADEKYTLISVAGPYAGQHLDRSAHPDVIMYVHAKREDIQENITYNGQTYILTARGEQLYFNDTWPALYLREQ